MNLLRKKATLNFILLGFVSLMIVLCYLVRFTGGKIHAMASLALLIVMIIHICKHKKKIKYIPVKYTIVNVLMGLFFVLIVLSGILLHPMHKAVYIVMMHRGGSCLLVISCMIHVYQHRTKFRLN